MAASPMETGRVLPPHVEQQQPWASNNVGAGVAARAAAVAEGRAFFSIAMMTELQSQEARRQELTNKAQRVPLALTAAGRRTSGDATAAARHRALRRHPR